MRCTGRTRCNEPPTTILRWSEEIMLGWTVTNDRTYCTTCKDSAIARLNERGIVVNLTALSIAPVIA